MTQRIATSGAVRDGRDGKGRYDLIHPFATRALALAMEEGAKHYGDRNWEKGQYLSWYLDSGPRHIDQFRITGDPKHLRAAMWNMHAAVATLEMIELGILPAEYDDLPHYLKGDQWPAANHDAASPQPTKPPNGKPKSEQPPPAPRPDSWNTPPVRTSWLRKTTAKAASTLIRLVSGTA